MLAPKAPRAAAIVRDGHDGCQAVEVRGLRPCRARREQRGLQSSKNDGEAGPPTQGDHSEIRPERDRRRLGEEPGALFYPPAVEAKVFVELS